MSCSLKSQDVPVFPFKKKRRTCFPFPPSPSAHLHKRVKRPNTQGRQAAAQAQRRPPIETPSRWAVGGVGSAETEPKFKGKQQAKIFGHLSGIRDLPFPFPETRARLKRLPAAGARRADRQAEKRTKAISACDCALLARSSQRRQSGRQADAGRMHMLASKTGKPERGASFAYMWSSGGPMLGPRAGTAVAPHTCEL